MEHYASIHRLGGHRLILFYWCFLLRNQLLHHDDPFCVYFPVWECTGRGGEWECTVRVGVSLGVCILGGGV